MAGISLQIFTELETVESQWREFEKVAHCTVFQTFDWLATWYRHIGSRRDITPIIVVGQSCHDTSFLIPLAIERRGMIRRLVWFGTEIADYNLPLLAQNFPSRVDNFREVWQEIIALIWSHTRFDLIDLDRMPAITHWPIHNPYFDIPRIWIESYSGHVATLTENWQEFYQSKMSSAHRQTDRRKFKRLAERGEIRFIKVTDDKDIQNTIATLINQKQASYRRMGVANLFASENYSEFYQSISTDPRLRDRVIVTRIDVGDQMVATGISLRHRDREYMIMSSYDQIFAKYSPGYKHLHELMRDAIDHGVQLYDFTIGDEPYKFDWADVHIPLLRHFAAYSTKGKLVAPAIRMKHRAEVWYNRQNQLNRTKSLIKRIKRVIRRMNPD